MLKYKSNYLEYKRTYTKYAYSRYDLWLNKFEALIKKEEADIIGSDILEFKLWIQQTFSEKSVQYAMTVIRNYFTFLKLSDIPCLNPLLIKAPRARAQSYEAVSPEDLQKIIFGAKKYRVENKQANLQAQLIISLLGETGVRVSELISICKNKINLGKWGAVIENKKNVDSRWIYWSEQTNKLLENYLNLVGESEKGSEVLFINPKTKQPLTCRTVERIVKNCSESMGIKNVVPHSFRHGKAHTILERGGTVADVQKTLGHRASLSSMKYLQLNDHEHERRSKLFFAQPKPISTVERFDMAECLV